MTIGVNHPVIILPKGFTVDLTAGDLDAVALHEMAHVKRFDVLTLTLVSLVRAVLFFHPLVWIAARKVAVLAEQACDDAVLDVHGEPVTYAKMLTRIAERLPNRSIQTELAAGFLISKSAFLRRVEAILSDRRDRIRKLSRLAFVGIVGAGVLSVLVTLAFPLGEKNKPVGEMVTVFGKVLYDGFPVSGAKVYLNTPSMWLRGHDSWERIGKTKNDGSFSFEFETNLLNKQWLLPRVVVFDPRYAAGWKTLSNDTDFEKITIHLGKPTTVSGIVKDKKGNPIRGARVVIRTMRPSEGNWHSFINGTLPELIKTTERDGRFVLRNIPEGTNMYLAVSGEGYERILHPHRLDTFHNMILAGSKNIEVTLAPEGRIEGRVVYRDTGKPAKHVKLHAVSLDYRILGSDIITTGSKGEFTITNLAQGVYHVEPVHEESFPEWTAKTVEHVAVEADKTTGGIELRLIRGGIITGRITDEESGAPLPVISVSAAVPKLSTPIILGKALTDENGVYRIRSVPGTASVSVYAPPGYKERPRSVSTIEVREGETAEGIDFLFKKGVTVTGKALSPEGDPVSGAEITRKYAHINLLGTETDAHGEFTLTGLKEGDEIYVEALHKALHLKGEAECKAIPGEELIVNLQRYETTTISGRVIDEQGNSMPGINIVLYYSKRSRDNVSLSVAQTVLAVTDDEGNYRVTDFMIDDSKSDGVTSRSLSAVAEGYKSAGISTKDLKPNVYNADDVVMIKDTADRWIEGTITGSDGKPVVGARVNNSSNTKQDFTDVRGYYRLDKFNNIVEQSIKINHKDYGLYEFKYITTNEKHDFILVKGDRYLEGKVVDTNNDPVEGARVSIRPQEQASGYIYMNDATTDSTGSFRLESIFDDTVTILISHIEKGYNSYEDVQTNRDDGTFEIKPRSPKEPKKLDWEFDKKSVHILADKPAPELQVAQWLNCDPVSFEDLRGKTIILDFWTSANEQSMEAVPLMKGLRKGYSDKDLVIIAIHEHTENIEDLKKLIAAEEITYRVAADRKSHEDNSMGLTFDAYGLTRRFFPNMIIDKNGTLHTDIFDRSVLWEVKKFIEMEPEND